MIYSLWEVTPSRSEGFFVNKHNPIRNFMLSPTLFPRAYVQKLMSFLKVKN
ncbi:uncharacterized protein METZ01_LOCUS396832 [marine metagenome]|uniref:Uncharacterized protein n=1 Tax=marine metagenome TaxID=408172 RepID=A0A382VDJ3_9ZZZZ